MTTTKSSLTRRALLALGCAFSLALVSSPALKAAGTDTLQPLADKAPALPVTSKIEKKTGGEGGPFVLTLTNSSKSSLKVTAKILLAVAFHAESKAKHLPEHTLEAGQTWTIADLVAEDKVILTAKDFATLEIIIR